MRTPSAQLTAHTRRGANSSGLTAHAVKSGGPFASFALSAKHRSALPSATQSRSSQTDTSSGATKRTSGPLVVGPVVLDQVPGIGIVHSAEVKELKDLRRRSARQAHQPMTVHGHGTAAIVPHGIQRDS
jgi:hypothetical protein